MHQPGLGRLDLAAVAASTFRIEEQIARAQKLGNICLEREQVGGVLGVAPDRNRAGDVTMNETERAGEQIDAGSDDRRPDAVVVQYKRLDEVVGVAAVIRRVDDAAC